MNGASACGLRIFARHPWSRRDAGETAPGCECLLHLTGLLKRLRPRWWSVESTGKVSNAVAREVNLVKIRPLNSIVTSLSSNVSCRAV